MSPESAAATAALILLAAALYSSVGHGGASGYLAVMALVGVAPLAMRPTALVLNLLVASIAAVRFGHAGHFNARLFWPFALTSVPAAFVGGALVLPGGAYRAVVGVVLLYSAARMLLSPAAAPERAQRHPPLPLALGAGAGIGLLSGLVGVGGGIFLSPLLLLNRWGGLRETAAVAAAFIWVNSAAGLLGHLASVEALPAELPVWAAAAAAGGWAGASYGSRRSAAPVLRRLLALVLAIAGVKLLLP